MAWIAIYGIRTCIVSASATGTAGYCSSFVSDTEPGRRYITVEIFIILHDIFMETIRCKDAIQNAMYLGRMSKFLFFRSSYCIGFLLKSIHTVILYPKFSNKKQRKWYLSTYKSTPVSFFNNKGHDYSCYWAQTITAIVRHAYFKTKLILPLASQLHKHRPHRKRN